jgi:hypothetical protein
MQKIIFTQIVAIFAIIISGCVNLKNDFTPLPLTEQEISLLEKMGAKILADGSIEIGKVTIDRRKMEISFPAKLNLRSGDLEVLICTPSGRTHEGLIVAELDPFHLQLALILLGAENGLRAEGEHLPQGSLLFIDVKAEGETRHSIEQWLFDKRNKCEKKNKDWVFVGSNFTHDGVCLAKEEGNIVNVWSFGNTILDNPSNDANYDDVFEVFTSNLPENKTNLTVYISIKSKI